MRVLIAEDEPRLAALLAEAINDNGWQATVRTNGATALTAARTADPQLAANWLTVLDWSEQARYDVYVAPQQAQNFYAAVTGRRNGMLTWLKKHW